MSDNEQKQSKGIFQGKHLNHTNNEQSGQEIICSVFEISSFGSLCFHKNLLMLMLSLPNTSGGPEIDNTGRKSQI